MVRGLFPHGEFIEVYCNASIEVCESRDVEGLYKKARAGEIKNFTGIDSPYETPINSDLELNTGALSLDSCVDELLEYLRKKDLFYV